MNDISYLEESIKEIIEQEHESRNAYNECIIESDLRAKLLRETTEILNEAYVGKTDTLQKAEEQLGIVRMQLDRNKAFDSNPEVIKFNRLIEEQFGMKLFALHLDPHKYIDAYTMTLCTNFDIAGNIDYSKSVIVDRANGFRFKSGNNFCIQATMSFGILGNPDLTDAEVLAILLHEIGHNFGDFIDNKIKLNNINTMKAYKEMLLYDAIMNSALIITIPLAIIDYKRKYREFTNDYKLKTAEKGREKSSDREARKAAKKADREDFFNDLKTTIFKYSPIRKALAKSNAKSRDLYRDELIKSARESISRRDEIIADKFVGIYGYGVELSTAFHKMDTHIERFDEWLNKLPGGEEANRTWQELLKDINEFDCHPHTIQRINENIKLLKNELEQDDMDPKMKDVIVKQIKEMENVIKDIVDKSKKNPDNIYYNYAAFVNEELPDAVSEKIEDEIADELNKIISKKK